MNLKAKDKIEAAISRLIIFRPLYGTVFMNLNAKQNSSLPTMGVGIHKRVSMSLYYNPEFVLGLDQKQLRAVLQHEALHVLLHHIARAKHFNYNFKLFNIAADLAINCNIEGLPDWVFYPKKMGFSEREAAEWYYNKMKKESDEQLEKLLEGGDLLDDHSMWGDCDADIIREKCRAIAEKAIKAQERRGWGDIPGGLAQAIIAANTPVVNWKREVRYFINQLVEKGRRSTRTRPNRRYGYVHPGTRKDYTSKILVAMDTSGSVSDKDLEDFGAEINGLIDHVSCDLIFFDTKLYGEPKPYKRPKKELEVEGRGGTNFEPVMSLVEESGYDGVIIMSDGFAEFPPAPRSARVLWALTEAGAGVEPPYGKKVVIDTSGRA
jgi:predicted metal-dependent peptidase